MGKSRSIKTNAVLNTIKTCLGIAFPLITFPYISRVLGVDALGEYNFSASIISYFSLFAALGIATYGIREGARYRETDKMEQFVSELFSINMITTAISYIALILVVLAIPHLHNYVKAISILSIEILAATIGVAWLCNVFEDFLFITIRTIIIQGISLVCIFLLIKTETDLYKYVAIMAISNFIANLINYFYIRSKYCRFKLTLNIRWTEHIKPILTIFWINVAVIIYVSSDATMLGFMTSDHEVGLYTTAVKIYTLLKNVITAILVVIIPRFSIMFANCTRRETDLFFSKVFNTLTVLMMPMIVGLFAISDDVVLLISGIAFADSATPLRLLSLAIAFSLYAFLYIQCVLIPVKREDVVFKATATSAVVNVLLNLFLIPIWGKNAAAITTIIAEITTLVIVVINARQYVSAPKISHDLKSVIVGCCGIICACLLAGHISRCIPRIIIAIISSVLIYLLILILMKNESFLAITNSIRRRYAR